MKVEIDLTDAFDKAKKLTNGLAELAGLSDDLLAPVIAEKCKKAYLLLAEIHGLLKPPYEPIS